MALHWFTANEVRKIEDDLQATITALREIRDIFEAHDAKRMKLNLNTTRSHANWLRDWAEVEPPRTRVRVQRSPEECVEKSEE